jgi:hypothetical protein
MNDRGPMHSGRDIVVIGASAGGVEALETLVPKLPVEGALEERVALRLSRRFASATTSLRRRATSARRTRREGRRRSSGARSTWSARAPRSRRSAPRRRVESWRPNRGKCSRASSSHGCSRGFESLEESKSRLETAFEELQSTAEELETTREELQSTNEGLETMNEELQSTNEELETINDELRPRTLDLKEVNAFVESILLSLEAAASVLDTGLEVRAWNEFTTDLWGLRPDEVQAQHFSTLDIGLPVDALLPLLRSVLAGEDASHKTVVAAINGRERAIECHVPARSCSRRRARFAA